MKKLLCLLAAVLILACAVCLPAAAEETENFVYDVAGILDTDDMLALNDAAREVSLRHGCGVYITVFDDMGEYGYSNIEKFSEAVFDQWELGIGEDRTSINLVLSMAERDYDLDAHGEAAHTAFTDYGKERLADEFKDNFRVNDWAGGFADYIKTCDYMLTRAENGDPIDVPGYNSRANASFTSKLGKSILPGLIVGVIIAFIYCSALKSKMKSAKIADEASAYVVPQGIRMEDQQDVFTHTTVTRQRIERDSGSRSGGTHVNSSGHSHSSGKF